MTKKKRKRHTPEQIVNKRRDAGAMLNAGQELAAVLQSLGVSEATYHRWPKQYGGMKASAAKRLKKLDGGQDANRYPSCQLQQRAASLLTRLHDPRGVRPAVFRLSRKRSFNGTLPEKRSMS
jgi:putative transposase